MPRALKRPLWRNWKSYVWKHVGFHLKPAPSKNIENWQSISILNIRIFEKKVIFGFWEIPYLNTRFQKKFFELINIIQWVIAIQQFKGFGLQEVSEKELNMKYAKNLSQMVPTPSPY